MPTHPIRWQDDTGHLHFLTWSCAERNPYLTEPGAKEVFEGLLEETRRDYRFDVVGYVIMPEHVHLLVSEPVHAKLADAISVLKSRSAKKLLGDRDRYWFPRYHDFNVYTERKRIEKLRYMHRNPVTRGLVTRPEDYRWSSFRRYALLARGTVEVATERTVLWAKPLSGPS